MGQSYGLGEMFMTALMPSQRPPPDGRLDATASHAADLVIRPQLRQVPGVTRSTPSAATRSFPCATRPARLPPRAHVHDVVERGGKTCQCRRRLHRAERRSYLIARPGNREDAIGMSS